MHNYTIQVFVSMYTYKILPKQWGKRARTNSIPLFLFIVRYTYLSYVHHVRQKRYEGQNSVKPFPVYHIKPSTGIFSYKKNISSTLCSFLRFSAQPPVGRARWACSGIKTQWSRLDTRIPLIPVNCLHLSKWDKHVYTVIPYTSRMNSCWMFWSPLVDILSLCIMWTVGEKV